MIFDDYNKIPPFDIYHSKYEKIFKMEQRNSILRNKQLKMNN